MIFFVGVKVNKNIEIELKLKFERVAAKSRGEEGRTIKEARAGLL